MTDLHGLDTTSAIPEVQIHPELLNAQQRLFDVLKSHVVIHDGSPTGLMNLAADALKSLFDQRQVPPPGWPVTNDSKYTTDGEYLINRASGERIPHDMPVFTMLAKDPYMVATLTYYAAHINDPAHQTAVGREIDRTLTWQRENPTRMRKEPDTAI